MQGSGNNTNTSTSSASGADGAPGTEHDTSILPGNDLLAERDERVDVSNDRDQGIHTNNDLDDDEADFSSDEEDRVDESNHRDQGIHTIHTNNDLDDDEADFSSDEEDDYETQQLLAEFPSGYIYDDEFDASQQPPTTPPEIPYEELAETRVIQVQKNVLAYIDAAVPVNSDPTLAIAINNAAYALMEANREMRTYLYINDINTKGEPQRPVTDISTWYQARQAEQQAIIDILSEHHTQRVNAGDDHEQQQALDQWRDENLAAIRNCHSTSVAYWPHGYLNASDKNEVEAIYQAINQKIQEYDSNDPNYTNYLSYNHQQYQKHLQWMKRRADVTDAISSDAATDPVTRASTAHAIMEINREMRISEILQRDEDPTLINADDWCRDTHNEEREIFIILDEYANNTRKINEAAQADRLQAYDNLTPNYEEQVQAINDRQQLALVECAQERDNRLADARQRYSGTTIPSWTGSENLVTEAQVEAVHTAGRTMLLQHYSSFTDASELERFLAANDQNRDACLARLHAADQQALKDEQTAYADPTVRAQRQKDAETRQQELVTAEQQRKADQTQDVFLAAQKSFANEMAAAAAQRRGDGRIPGADKDDGVLPVPEDDQTFQTNTNDNGKAVRKKFWADIEAMVRVKLKNGCLLFRFIYHLLLFKRFLTPVYDYYLKDEMNNFIDKIKDKLGLSGPHVNELKFMNERSDELMKQYLDDWGIDPDNAQAVTAFIKANPDNAKEMYALAVTTANFEFQLTQNLAKSGFGPDKVPTKAQLETVVRKTAHEADMPATSTDLLVKEFCTDRFIKRLEQSILKSFFDATLLSTAELTYAIRQSALSAEVNLTDTQIKSLIDELTAQDPVPDNHVELVDAIKEHLENIAHLDMNDPKVAKQADQFAEALALEIEKAQFVNTCNRQSESAIKSVAAQETAINPKTQPAIYSGTRYANNQAKCPPNKMNAAAAKGMSRMLDLKPCSTEAQEINDALGVTPSSSVSPAA